MNNLDEKNIIEDTDIKDTNKYDPWRFPPYTILSCLLSLLSGFFVLNFFNIMFTTRAERILTWEIPDRILFITIYFFIPVVEIIAIITAIKAKRNEEFWYAASIALAVIVSLSIILIYLLAGDYVFSIC